MAVTDMTESLPWWARGAAPTGAGPVPPQGGANSQAWLQYLAQMFSPGAAQAGEAPPTNGGPSPDDIAALKAAQANPTPPIPNNAIVPPVGPPPAPPAPPLPQPDPVGNYVATVGNHGSWPTPGVTGPVNPNAPSPQAAPMSGQRPVLGPLAGRGGPAPAPFIGIDAPNASPQTSMRGGPQGTALNLAGLFGGGKPAVSNTSVKGPMANGGPPSGDNWDIDPQTGDITPNFGNDGSGPQRGPRSKWPLPPRRPAGM